LLGFFLFSKQKSLKKHQKLSIIKTKKEEKDKKITSKRKNITKKGKETKK